MTSRISQASKALRDVERQRIMDNALAMIPYIRKKGGHVKRKHELALKADNAAKKRRG